MQRDILARLWGTGAQLIVLIYARSAKRLSSNGNGTATTRGERDIQLYGQLATVQSYFGRFDTIRSIIGRARGSPPRYVDKGGLSATTHETTPFPFTSISPRTRKLRTAARGRSMLSKRDRKTGPSWFPGFYSRQRNILRHELSEAAERANSFNKFFVFYYVEF